MNVLKKYLVPAIIVLPIGTIAYLLLFSSKANATPLGSSKGSLAPGQREMMDVNPMTRNIKRTTASSGHWVNGAPPSETEDSEESAKVGSIYS